MSLYSKYIVSKLINVGCGSKPIRKQREKVLPLCEGEVLEIGAGSGLNFPYYDPNNVSKIYALEPDSEMLRQARIAAKSWDLNIEFIESGAEEIALGDNVVDTVLLTYTLCSIRYPELALKEIRRVLRKNGKLVYCEHGIAPERGVRNVQNIMNYFYPYLAGGCNLNRDIPDLIRKNGFKLEDFETMYLPGTLKWSGYNYWGVAH